MADISILVDYSDVKEANTQILAMGTNAGKSARVFEQAFNRAEASARKQLTSSKQLASAEAALAAQRERAMAKESANLERLAQKYKPLYAASKLYERSLEEINEAHAKGVLTTKQHAQQVDFLNQQYQEFSNGTAGALNVFNQGLSRSNRSISRMSVLTQQAGYQVGDFLVQVQSGTNAFVAFGQQATQVAGTLTLLGGKWVGIGTALGIAIPLATAAAAAFMRTREEADESSDKVSQLESDLKSLTDSLRDWERAKQQVAMGVTADELLGIETLESAKTDLREAREELDRLVGVSQGAGDAMGQNLASLAFLASGARAEEEEARNNYLEARIRLNEILARQDEQRAITFEQEASQLREKQRLLEVSSRYGEDSIQYLELESQLRRAAFGRQVAQLDLSERQKINLIEQNNALESQILAQERLETLTSSFGPLFQGFVSSITEATEEAFLLDERLGEGVSQVLLLAGVDISSPLSAAEERAAALAAQLGVTFEEGERTAQILDRISGFDSGSTVSQIMAIAKALNITTAQAIQLARSLPNYDDGGVSGPDGAVTQSQALTTVEPVATFSSPAVTGGGGSGGGRSGGSRGTPKETAEDFLNSLEDEVKTRRSLIGLYGEGRDIQERVLALQEEAQSKDLEISEGRLEAIARQENAVEQMLSRQEELFSTFSGQVEDSLMGLVEGSLTVEDAFKSMIYNILLETYRQNVIKPVASSVGSFITGLFGFANGGVFSGGSEVKAFANGGVVNGPTVFPMNNGTGLMGEAGPEAIMPLKRGPDGKLGVQSQGGQQPIQVTFNISTPDVRGFEQSKTQIASSMQRALQASQRNQ